MPAIVTRNPPAIGVRSRRLRASRSAASDETRIPSVAAVKTRLVTQNLQWLLLVEIDTRPGGAIEPVRLTKA